MFKPETLLREAIALRDSDPQFGSLSETVDVLDVRGVMDDKSVQTWTSAQETGRANGLEFIFLDEFDRTTRPTPRMPITVRIKKPNSETIFHAFTIAGFEEILRGRKLETSGRRVLLACDIEPFDTMSCSFEHWTLGSSHDLSAETLISIEPRRFIYANVPDIVPDRVGSLILNGTPRAPSPAFDAWLRYVAIRLPFLLTNEVRSDGRQFSLLFRGPRITTITFSVDGPTSKELIDAEMLVAKWVYTEGAGIESRHTFFTAELARIWPENASWNAGFEQTHIAALEAAKSANNLLLSGKSSDVLKSLSDLRKNMNDDVSRVTSQIRDLSTSLWRDFVIAFTALSARVALIANNSVGARLIPILALIFLAYSVFVSFTANNETLQIGQDARKQWMDRVYKFLSQSETDALVSQPLTKAEALFRLTRDRVFGAYVVLAFLLLLSAVWQSDWTTSAEKYLNFGEVAAKVNIVNKQQSHSHTP